MQFPQINLNGTSRDSLLRDYRLVVGHLANALHAMRQCYPHGRDYQTLPNAGEAHATAMAEHVARMTMLRELIRQYEQLAEHVAE